jgi:hypothetical protein
MAARRTSAPTQGVEIAIAQWGGWTRAHLQRDFFFVKKPRRSAPDPGPSLSCSRL